MFDKQRLTIYLDPPHRLEAETGKINIFNLIRLAFEGQGFEVGYRDFTALSLSAPHLRRGYALYFMQEPMAERSLTLRRAYHYPFWRIDQTNERWRTDVALASFDADAVDPGLALPFARRWRQVIMGQRSARRDGYVFVPLQGRLLDQRSFQSMSPLAMLETALERDPRRPHWITLHPNESYSAEEMKALEALLDRHPRLRLATGDALDLLAGCDYVVTQNSSLALTGFFLSKPALLFAEVDFHHIAVSVPRLGLDRAYEALGAERPDFDRYLHWFLQENSINGGKEDATARILDRAARFGWPVNRG